MWAYLVQCGAEAGASRACWFVAAAGCGGCVAILGFLYFADCRAMELRAYLVHYDANRLL